MKNSYPPIRLIRDLEGGRSSQVQLVEVDGVLHVLKTATPQEIQSEMRFHHHLHEAGMTSLHVHHPNLPENQMLLRYVEGSPGLGSRINSKLARQWGEITAKMHAVSHYLAGYVTETGDFEAFSWGDFVESDIKSGVDRQARKQSDLSETEIARMVAFIRPLRDVRLESYSLVHADLHSNNVMVGKENPILFDKGSAVLFGDPLYDLATVAFEFDQAYLSSRPHKHVRHWKAFVGGYGTEPQENPDFHRYVLLRGLDRYPNPFVPKLKQVLEKAIAFLTEYEKGA